MEGEEARQAAVATSIASSMKDQSVRADTILIGEPWLKDIEASGRFIPHLMRGDGAGF